MSRLDKLIIYGSMIIIFVDQAIQIVLLEIAVIFIFRIRIVCVLISSGAKSATW